MAGREDKRPKVHRRTPAHSEYDQHQVTVTASVQPQLRSIGAGPSVMFGTGQSVIFSQSVSNSGASKSFSQSVVSTISVTESTRHDLSQTIGGTRPKRLSITPGTRSNNRCSPDDLWNSSNIDTTCSTSHKQQVNLALHKCIECQGEKFRKEERVPLKKILSKFTDNIKQRLFDKHPNLSVQFQRSNERLICLLRGTEALVLEGQNMLRQIESELKGKTVNFSTDINHALHELFVERLVNDRLNREYPACIAEQEENKIHIYGLVNETELSKACQFVGQMIIECKPMPLYGDFRRNGKDIIKTHFRTKFKDNIAVDIDNTWRLHLIGVKDVVKQAEEEINKIKEGSVSLHTSMTCKEYEKEETIYYPVRDKILFHFMEKSVVIKDIAKQFNIDINLLKQQYSVEIKGPNEHVKQALEELEAIGNAICSEDVVICNQEAVTYFTRDQNNDYMDCVERKYDVLLQKEVVFRTYKKTVTKQLFQENIIWSDLSGRRLIVEMNHWDDVQASVKVKLIKRGPYGQRFIRNSSHITIGVPDWVSGQQSGEFELESCVRSMLTKASDGKKKAVALPLAPIESWPFEEYMHCFVKSSVHWLLEKSDVLPASVMLFTDSQNYFQRTDTYIGECITNTLKDLQKPKAIEINVIKGQLNQTEADVIVNTTAPNLDLSNGRVSSALLKSAGSKLQQECRKQFPDGITPDIVAVTGGYNLMCKQVFHITLPPFIDEMKTDIESIRKAMLLCLKTASDYGHETIAFPVIGTGNLQYPVELVVSEMFGSIERHRVECPNTKLQEARFVIFPKNTELLFQIFKRHEENSRHFMKEELLKLEPCCEVKFKVTGMKKNVIDAKAELESYHRTVKRKFSLSKDVNNLEIYENGNLVIRVYEANIIAVPAECIVNAANQDLKHVGGVARVIAKAAGESLLADCKKVFMSNEGPLNVSAVVCTAAGNLDFKCVIHAVGPRWSDYEPITEKSLKQCSDDLKRTVTNCLRMAESKQLKSLVMSTISSGAFGVPKQVCAVQYAEAILEFSENRCTSLGEIHIVDKNHEMIDIVQKTFSAMITERKPAPFSLSDFVQSMGQAAFADRKNNNTSSDDREHLKFTGRDNPNSMRDEVKQEMSNTDRVQSPGEQMMQPSSEAVNEDEAATDVDCVICMDKVTDAKKLKCGHIYCTECIDGYFRVKKVCPTCGKVCGTITGDQPDGSMEISKSSRHLKGFEHTKSLVITYRFRDGNQRPDHPNPGALYKGIARSAYLPDTTEGREICAMLKVAFERRLVFTIGHSRTTGRDGVITWNDIHHKTDSRPNTQFGYPDDTYLQRVREELEVKGVTTEDLEMEFIQKLGKDQFKETIN